MQIERSTIVPGDLDAVREALLDPELLSAWLGPWTDLGDGEARVVTDDGVTRHVSDHHLDLDGGVRWSWAPLGQPDDRSEVTVELEQLDVGTRIVIHETRIGEHPCERVTTALELDASVHRASGDRWTSCLLALGALLEQRRLVAV